jgi:aminopeptidase N
MWGDAHRVEHAMECLKAAMQHEWEKWGHEYHSDSGVFMTLAVDAFIFGAMENTGLNIFNSSAVLADAKTATDGAFKNIDRIIDHEFCHDESGNWVVPRDWFQISFKEGLTVFRDQTYTADRYGRTLSQISNVRRLRGMVFPYDSGAMTHPMVLQSYLNTDNNNYDVLTYPKGAAVNRMIQTLVGEEAYEKAYREFFSNKEVKTATIEEYFRAIARSSGKNLDQFIGTWLNQAGVPELEIQTEYKEAEKQFVLKIKQILSVSQDDPQGKKTAFHIPLIIGLVGPQGQDYPLENGGLLEITELENHFVFSDIPQRPRLSLNRDGITYARFSYTEDSTPSSNDLTFLSQKDPNPFKRWDALQEQSTQILLDLIDQKKEKVSQEELQPIIDAFASVLRDQNLDDGLKADLLVLPSGGNLTDLQAPGTVDPVRIYNLRKSIVQTIGKSLEDLLLKTYESKTSDAPYVFNPEEMNRRSLMNTCLSYLVQGNEGQYLELALKQFDAQQNYNDVISALEEISESKNEEIRQTCFNKMYEEWKDNKLVMNTWISFRIFSDSNPLELAKELESHPVFDINNPNKVRALVGGFIGNTPHFHKEDGSGYAYLADWIIRLDEINPIIASGMARVFTKRSIYIERIQKQLQEQIERIRQERGDKLSSNVKEVLDRSSMK